MWTVTAQSVCQQKDALWVREQCDITNKRTLTNKTLNYKQTENFYVLLLSLTIALFQNSNIIQLMGHNSEVSSFQRLLSIYTNVAFGTDKHLLFMEVCLIQRCPDREVPLYL